MTRIVANIPSTCQTSGHGTPEGPSAVWLGRALPPQRTSAIVTVHQLGRCDRAPDSSASTMSCKDLFKVRGSTMRPPDEMGHEEATLSAMNLQTPSPRPSVPQSLRPSRHKSRGQALVEFAFVFPIFMVILTSLLYFGFLLYSKMSIINAAREGAHYSILLDPGDAAFATKVAGQVRGAAGAGLNPSSVTTVTTGFKVDTTTHMVTSTSCTWGSSGTCKAGDAVTVTVTYPFANPVPMHLALLGNVIIDLPSSFNLISTVQMVHE